MAGLSFTDEDDVTPDTPLLDPFLEWVTHLSLDRSAATVRSYVFDCRTLARILLERQEKHAARDLPATPPPVDTLSPEIWSDACALIGGLTLGDLHPRYLADMLARFAAGHKPSTRRRAAAAWSVLCEYLTRRGFLAANPMRDPRIERGPRPAAAPAPFELAEADVLLKTLATADVARTSRKPWPLRDLALASILLTTGIRLAEACTAQVGGLRDRDQAARLQVLGKGNKYRTIPVPAATRDLVKEYLEDRSERLGAPQLGDPLFLNLKPDGRAFTPRAMEHLVYRWYERAGISPQGSTCVHALRHTFATQAIDSGISITELQELLGHESLETTRRYLRSVGQGLRAAVEASPSAQLVRDLQGTRTE